MATVAGTGELAKQRFGAGYQVLMVAILSLNFGIVFFDRNALNFLMPFVKPDLQLSNVQVGLFQSALSLTWALAALGMGKLSDRLGRRKLLLVGSTLAFSACSFLSGFAATFGMLLATRLLMGVAEGGSRKGWALITRSARSAGRSGRGVPSGHLPRTCRCGARRW